MDTDPQEPESSEPPPEPSSARKVEPQAARATFGPVEPVEAEADETKEPDVVKPAPRAGHLGGRRTGPGVRIPGYHIQGVIGRGSTGTVYRARQENVDREVALKVLHEDLSTRPRMVRRLQREARTTARLAHPHIVSAIDMGRTGERWWFAMELVDGPSLALRLRQDGRLSEREALRLFIPLCEALVHIWENGVVHRDIKPANILIDRVSGARLADLGLAFADDDPHLTGSEGTLGTPHYISPEQARDPSSVDIRTDIWSFGATLFHTVCGEPPLRGANVAEVLSGVLYGHVPDPEDLEPDLSRGLSLVLRKCLSRDFERRYQTPRELLLDLERVRERRRPKVRVASLEPTAGSRASIGRLLFATGILVVLGIAGMLLWQRPWDDAGGRVEYAPLTAMATDLGGVGSVPGTWLARLEGIKAELPSADLTRWRELHAEGRIWLAGVMTEVLDEAREDFDDALGTGDYLGAGVAIGAGLEERMLELAGLSPELAGPEVQMSVAGLRHRLDRAVDSAESEARETLERAFEDDFVAGVEELIAKGRWSDARERLAMTPAEFPAELGLALPGLPPERGARLLEGIGKRLLDARMDLDRRWSALDAELVRWIELELRDLEAELSEALVPINAGERLTEAFDLELFGRGLTPEQMPVEPVGLARGKLSQAVRDLDDMEARVAASRAPTGLVTADLLVAWLDEAACGDAWRERRYEEVDTYWAARLLEASGAFGETETRERALAKRQEAALLTALRDRALAALQPLDGTLVELHMSPGVRAQGDLAFIAPGAAGGMVFEVGADRTYELFLSAPRGGLPRGARLVHPIDLELLAGFDVERVLADPGMLLDADLLTLALFRAREQDEDAARVLIASRAFGPELEVLAGELRRGLERSASALGARRQVRLADARGLLATLYLDETDAFERLARDPGRALATIRRLQSEFGDLPPVASASAQLSELESRLRNPGGKPVLADFEQAFGAGVANFVGPDKAELHYIFEGPSVPGFLVEDWTPDGFHWVSPADFVDDQDLITRPAPRLVLRKPMLVAEGDLVVEFDFVEPDFTSSERLVICSVAGFHVALRTAEGSSGSQLAVTTDGLDELVRELRKRPRAVSGRLLEAGSFYRLRVEVNQQRGRILVMLGQPEAGGDEAEAGQHGRLDAEAIVYRELFQGRLDSPMGRPGSAGVSLRASEALRLSSIWVLGPR